MEAIGFLSVIFQWYTICDMDLKHMLQIAIGCMKAIGFFSMIFKWIMGRNKDLKPNASNSYWVHESHRLLFSDLQFERDL
jgi:hypothetical protein